MNLSSLEIDSDGETSFDDEEKFSWRMDAAESLSDWTISILDEGDEHSETYHVHKNILSVGARRSEYFVPLMRSDSQFSESNSRMNSIQLQPLAAQAFPEMLDYIYDGHVNCTTENATALHYLGSYFGVRRLRWHVKNFLKQDICAANADVYFMHAGIFHDDKIQSAVADACVNDLLAIDTSSCLLQVTTADFWKEVLDRAPQTKGFRGHLSKLIAEFCRHHPDLELSTFTELTSRENLPEIRLAAALSFCQQPNFSLLEECEDSDLHSRCIECIAENWDEINWEDSEMQSTLMQMEKSLVIRLLVQTSVASQNRLGEMADELDDIASDRNRLKREKRSLQKSSKSLKKEISCLTKSKAALNESLRKMSKANRDGTETDTSGEAMYDSSGLCVTLEHPDRDRSLRKERQLSLSSHGSEKSWAHESRTKNTIDIPEIRSAIDFRNVFDPHSSHTA